MEIPCRDSMVLIPYGKLVLIPTQYPLSSAYVCTPPFLCPPRPLTSLGTSVITYTVVKNGALVTATK